MQIAINAYFSFSFLVAGIFLFYTLAVKSLRDGKAKTRYGEFHRQTEPCNFWLFVIVGILGAAISCCGAIFVLLHPLKI